MRISAALIAATFLGSTLPVYAQERPTSSDPAVYKVEFDIHDGSEEKPQPSQHFSMLVDESRKGIFQAVSRVPVDTGSSQYVDVGANIECTVHESEGRAALSASIELTSITGYVYLSAISEPIVGQRKAVFHTTVALGTRTPIMDDRNASLRRTDSQEPAGIPAKPLAAGAMHQVEATVTKLN